jgi:iron complex outermembrane receptor protein
MSVAIGSHRVSAMALVSASSAAWSALFAAMPAQAQTASQASESEGGIQEIVVTARKRVESTQDVPVLVSVIDATTLQNRNVTSLEGVAAISPQFTIGRAPSGSGATLVLRGVGSNSTSIGLEQSVAVVVDGVYYGQGRTINEGFFDLERVELLKGPQALFFGKNATAGVISFTTADPGDKLEVIGRAGYEFEAKAYSVEGIFSTPLSDTLGLRVGLRYHHADGGQFRNLVPVTTYTTIDRTTTAVPGVATGHTAPVGPKFVDGLRDIVGRATLKWTPTDSTTATIKASYSDDRRVSPAGNVVIFRCPTGTYQFNAAIPCESKRVVYQSRFPADIAATVPYAPIGGGLGNRYRAYAVTGTIEHQTDNFLLTWVNNYNRNRNIFIFDADAAYSAISAVQVFATEYSTFRAVSSEARIQSTFDGPINGMIGGYYQNTKRDYLAYTASGGLENSLAPNPFQRYLANSKDSETKGKTLAAFGQLTWKVVPTLEIAGGVRYTHETKDSFFLQPYSHPIRVTQGIFLPGFNLPSDQTFDDWSPEATVTWQPSDQVTVFGAYKTAYKSGGFSNSGILSPTAGIQDFEFEPETVEGFEGGIKTLLANRQLRVNLGAYSYKYKNLQLDFFKSDVFAFSTINVGSLRSEGFELEYQFAPYALKGFELHGSLNYNRSRYGNSPGAPCFQGQTQPQGCNLLATNVFTPGNPVPTGVTIGLPAAGGNANRQNLKGKPTAMAPDWTATLGLSYEHELGGGAKLGIAGDSRFSDDYITSAFGNFFTRQKSYLTFDASVRLKVMEDRLEFALIGKNLSDRFYRTGGNDVPNTGAGAGNFNAATARLGDQSGQVADGRTVTAQVVFRY